MDEAFANALMELRGPLFDTIFKEAGLMDIPFFCGAPAGVGNGEIEDEGQVGPEISGCGCRDRHDFIFRYAAASPLIGECTAGEPIGQDGYTGLQCGAYFLIDELGAAGHVEKHFSADVHPLAAFGEEDIANIFSDQGSTRLAKAFEFDAVCVEIIFKFGELG